jgi:hypothetical protein
MEGLNGLKADNEPGVLNIDFTTVIMWILGVLLLLVSALQI